MRTSPIRGSNLPLAAAVLLTACATTFGTQFARPPVDFVHLGQTTQAQIVERLGEPLKEGQHRRDGQLLHSIYYYFGSEMQPPKDPDTVCFRRLVFGLADDIVISEAFTSTCAADHTDFDERKAADIVKGRTRCDEVIAMMGRPNTRAIDPVADKKGELTIGYTYRDMGRVWGPRKNYSKELMFLCNSDGIVREMSFLEFGSR
jgi:hypothetical protein